MTMNRTAKIITASLVVGVILIILLVVALTRNKGGSKTDGNIVPTRTSEPTQSATNDSVKVLSVSPIEDIKIAHLPVIHIIFEFDKKIDPNQFAYQISPEMQAEIEFKGNQVIFKPLEDVWPTATNITISILPQTRAVDGSSLDQPFQYTFTTSFPGGA